MIIHYNNYDHSLLLIRYVALLRVERLVLSGDGVAKLPLALLATPVPPEFELCPTPLLLRGLGVATGVHSYNL